MLSSRRTVSALFLLMGLFGCDDPPSHEPPPTFSDDSGTETSDGGAQDGSVPPRKGPAFAVVSSDYTSTAVSLLDWDGTVMADNYVNSTSQRAGLVTALSGDVELPNRSGERGVLVLLDRYKTDVITRLRLSDAEVLGQVKTHAPPPRDSESAYSSNPHDYVYIDETTAWITRYEPNLDPGVPELEKGTDLLRIDPTKMERTEDRIDLSVLNTTGTRLNPDTQMEEEVEVYARPSRMARIGDTLVVGLSRLSFDFSAAGAGAVAIVDLKERKVSGFELEGLQNCGSVAPVPESTDTVLVSCRGHWASDQRAGSGLVLLRVNGGDVEVAQRWSAKDHPEARLAVSSPVALGGTWVAGVENGEWTPDNSGRPDVMVVTDLATGEQRELFQSVGAYVLGSGAFDPVESLLLVPDASTDADKRPTAGVRRFLIRDMDEVEELETIKVAESTTMPVRSIRPL